MSTSSHKLPRLIAVDVDGTLLDKKHTIHPITKQAIHKIRKSHPQIPIIMATGRPYATTIGTRKELNIEAFPSIHFHGALTLYHDDHTPNQILAPPQTTINNLLRAVEQLNVAIIQYSEDTITLYKNTIEGSSRDWKRFLSSFGEQLEPQYAVASNIIKIAICGEDDVFAELLQVIEPFKSDVYVTQAIPNMLEIGALGVNKGVALRQVCSLYNIDVQEVIAFGDGENDIEMLQLASTGVAMANAMPRTRSLAKYHTSSVEEGGVGVYLDRVFSQ